MDNNFKTDVLNTNPFYLEAMMKLSENNEEIPPTWLDELEDYILSNLENQNLTNDHLAEIMGISVRGFYYRVKELTGLSPNVYIREIRLNKAHEYLQNGTYSSVRETAMAVGFETTDYFTFLFKKQFGQLPSKVLKGND